MTAQTLHPRPRLLPLGDSAWTVEFGDDIAPEIHARVLGFAAALAAAQQDGTLARELECVPAFRSLTVHFDPARVDHAALAERLLAIAGDSGSLQASGAAWRIPVCFDAEFAPDLAAVAESKGLTPDAVVRLMTETEFTVYMLGFLPGFPYLGGLPAALDMPRLATPRKVVPARSIAIAGRTCAAYPWQSPGGWRLMGRTPVHLFDPARSARPALLAPGDRVRWQAVDRDAYAAIEARCARGDFDPDELRAREAGA
ncbi:5-oxoprolinase subunit PxpB [Azospira restricta]|uniref:5-oxoprolinase subunit PxpB n=1 Tax=Azospira restricta TaxID=404405 RepID=A0A974PX98_9RHOO|nr:5-oxoprolinase subunit PxpB [Azospira restricta]QRJ63105.1 5-oxoprolinase subunit PxpB [Azospira restricta]